MRRRRVLSASSSDDDDDDDDDSLLDLEALESSHVDGDGSHGSDAGSPASFAGFLELPPELRYRIWEAFCPDLTSRARFLHFEMSPASMAHRPSQTSAKNVWSVKDWMTLEDQTQALRSVMAVHRESRAMALKVFPDSLSIDSGSGDAIVRFNKDRDVVYVEGLERHGADVDCQLPNFAHEIVNTAVHRWKSPHDVQAVDSVAKTLRLLPNLRRIYFFAYDMEYESADIAWCISDCAYQYLTETFEKEPGFGEDTQSIACWPKVDSHPDFAKFQIPRVHSDGRPPGIDEVVSEYGVETWPMILFDLEFAVERYRSLHDPTYGEDLEQMIGFGPRGFLGPLDSDTDLDEYESEGIDDDEIMDYYDGSSEEHLIPESWSSSDAGFSSPEAETDDGGRAEPARRAPKRRIVTDSDDDAPVTDERRAKRARIRRVVEDSDDESDESTDEAPTRHRGKPAAAVSDSESDDDARDVHAVPRRQGGSSPSDGDSNSGSDESSPNQHTSLAERLQPAREAHSVSASDSEGVSRTVDGDEDEDEDDDDDEDEDDDDDEDEEEDGLIDCMAAESDSSGDGASDTSGDGASDTSGDGESDEGY